MSDLPDLKVRHKKVEDHARFDLRRFLYVPPPARNGRAWGAKWFLNKIDQEGLKPEKMERLSLLVELKEYFEEKLTMGGSVRSQETYLSQVQHFFNFSDQTGRPVTFEYLANCYLEYCEYLIQCYSMPSPCLNQDSAYGYAVSLSAIFAELLGLNSGRDLVSRTRLRPRKKMPTVFGREADKQNLEDAQKMGGFLVDLVKGITKESVLGQFPIRVPIRKGVVENDEIIIGEPKISNEVSALLSRPFDSLTGKQKKAVRQVCRRRESVDCIAGTRRWQYVNLRVQAEFLIFIAQTGMNVKPAKDLLRGEFRYKNMGDSLQVKVYKHRRGGEQTFPIYRSYKPYFQRFLSFVNYFFPESELMFPHFDQVGSLSESRRWNQEPLRKLLATHGLPWVPPKTIRGSRVNWILRESVFDFELTADMHQHHQETLHRHYDVSSGHRASAEITNYWRELDTLLLGDPKGSLIAGQCSGDPTPIEGKPPEVVDPNCSSQSGCLWCKNMRAVNTEDYVWSLVSFRRLKTIEAAGVMTTDKTPVDFVVDRLNQMIAWFREQGGEQAKWVKRSEMRMDEADYHPNWIGILDFLEE